jgi:FAD/FMN-containing dehydrogenase
MTHSRPHPFTPAAVALANSSGPTPLPDFIADLRRHVRGDVRDDAINRLLYSTDASLYQVMPHAVFLPRDGDDMQAAVETAIRYQIPLLARGGGSSLGGQAVNAALIMDTSRHLDGIVEINAEEQWVRVQPGVVLDTLNDALRTHRLQFGPDPASSNRATMAGIISNNASGSHSILYGMSADHVLEMTAILDDGSMAHLRPLDATQLAWERRQTSRLAAITADVAALVSDDANLATVRAGTPRHWRRSGGYNLARFVHDGTVDHFIPQDSRFNLCNLMTGAEGTLAAITELKLKLVPRPTRTALCIVEFPTLQASLEATPAILETAPSAVELVDDLSLRMAAAVPEYARLVRTFLRGDAFCFLGVEYYGESEAELRAKCDALVSHLRARQVPCGEITALLEPKQQAAVWNVRKVGLGLLMSVRSDFKPIPFIEDTAVPPQHLATYIPRIEAFCRARDVQMTYYAHASAGCLHIRPLINIKEAEQRMKMEAIAEFVADLQSDYGGSIWPGAQLAGRARLRPRTLWPPQRSEGHLRPAQPLQPRQHRRRTQHAGPPALWRRLSARSDSHTAALCRELHHGRGDVQRRRRLPEADDRRHVPQLYRHPRRGAQHAWARQPAALGAERTSALRRNAGRAPLSGHGTLRRVQGLQSRVPLVGGYGETENRIPGRVL